jgi:hypothetical protein
MSKALAVVGEEFDGEYPASDNGPTALFDQLPQGSTPPTVAGTRERRFEVRQGVFDGFSMNALQQLAAQARKGVDAWIPAMEAWVQHENDDWRLASA